EILFRNMLGVKRGRLDLDIDGIAVDVKNTMYSNWAIPEEAYDQPCVLIMEDERRAIFSMGVIVARESYLRDGKNKDSKSGIAADGRENIWWIAKEHPYPPNPWEFIEQVDRERIMAGRGGKVRVAALFEFLQGRPISRTVVEHVAQQKDAMKRVRRNGGARD